MGKTSQFFTILIVAVAAVAAGCQAQAPAAAPAQPPASAPEHLSQEPSAASAQEASPTEAPAVTAPTTTPTPAPGGVRVLTDEELQQELRRSAISTRAWPNTDFRIHSVSLREFVGGGPGRDDIPPIDNPRFVSATDADEWMNDREPVQVVDINGDARAYPLHILIWHEIVNDVVGGEPVAVTY